MLVYEGVSGAKSGSPRQIIKEAYKLYDFIREDTWLEMLSQRNDMAHLYDEEAAKRLMHTILSDYIPAFRQVRDGLISRYGDVLNAL